MRRAAIVGIFAAVMATAWTFLAAQQGQSLDFKAPNPAPRPTLGPEHAEPPVAVPPASAKTPQPAVADSGVVEPPPPPLSPLQQRFIELSAKKARSLNPEHASPGASLAAVTPAGTKPVSSVVWATNRDVISLDPIFSAGYPEYTADSLMCESLLRQAPDGSLSPAWPPSRIRRPPRWCSRCGRE